jgi:peptidoglycan DL-endopeptidase CwlO
MSITDVLSRISQIQQELAELSSGTLTSSSAAQAATSTSSATDTGDTASTSGTSFANALAQAQDTSATQDANNVSGGAGLSDAIGSTETGDADFGSTLSSTATPSALGAISSALGTTPATTALPTGAGSLLTSNQQQFASTLAADTGLNPAVVSAWVLAEESGSAAQTRQAQNNNDWLNVGYTDGGSYGTSDTIWSDPVSAANATAGWLKGQSTIPGYGAAGSGVESILQTVGQTPEAQITALQQSGWASSGYPNLPSLYAEVTG